MKILITADLHYREQWFRLLSRAAEMGSGLHNGDLLDMFNAEPRIVQARTVSRWIRELAKVTRVAICSGNHDNAGRQSPPTVPPSTSGYTNWEKIRELLRTARRAF